MDGTIKKLKNLLIAFICLFLKFIGTISPAQQALDELPPGELGTGTKLVENSVSDPVEAILGRPNCH
jgi:hypothetical protein